MVSCERPVGTGNLLKPFAFLCFNNKEIANALIQKASTKIKGFSICIKPPTTPTPPSEASAAASVSSNVGGGWGGEVEGAKVFVHNVSEETAADDLKKAFGKHGTITDAYNPRRGYAFVTFSTPDEVQAAIRLVLSSDWSLDIIIVF